MKKLLVFLAVIAFIGLGMIPALADSADPTIDYGDVTLSGGYQAGHFPQLWDLTACDMTISFTADLNGLVDDGGAHAWSEIGVRALGYGDFNPTWLTEGAGVWLSTDFEYNNPNTFDPDPVGFPTLDMDDKLILQKGGGLGEGSYNLPSTPPSPYLSASCRSADPLCHQGVHLRFPCARVVVVLCYPALPSRHFAVVRPIRSPGSQSAAPVNDSPRA